MEVHHHAHTARKKWTHYFWEFIMLFLAVFCGFLAEYQLEHKIEKNRERQFINSLVNDIKSDTARLNTIIFNRTVRESRLDSLELLLNSPSPGNYAKDIYLFAVTAARTNIIRFIPNDGTIQQLKSGGLRLIRKHHVADSIAKYDVTIRFLSRQGELEETLINDYRETAPNIFDARIFDQMLDSNNNVSRLLNGDPKLLAFTQKELQHWNYRMYSMKALNKAIRRDARVFLRQANNLLEILKEEYHLE
ncbi:MAG: hypothetical protein E6H07_04640 [Bacteroidetes bacterium]|nr:MAG: hypothetical protein E6H07_04640 [Bacteroidota bacterium]